METWTTALCCLALIVLSVSAPADGSFVMVKSGAATADIVVDPTNTAGKNGDVLKDAGQWLADSIGRASGAELKIVEKPGNGSAVIIARADAYAEVAAGAGLKPGNLDAYCIVTRPNRLYLLGNSASAARHAAAHLLDHLGFRFYAPSPKWHITPRLRTISIDLGALEKPALRQRGIWYAYGAGVEELKGYHSRWSIANRLTTMRTMQTGHSYGHIIGRNKEAFAAHPEYFALLESGERDIKRGPNARKFCFSNPGLIKLVQEDRIKLLEEYRAANPFAFMVSVDPSDGQGTCHCENCVALGTTSNRVFHLANQVAKAIREKHPDGWVGLYAYSSHRLPPTMDVEPNVYVQVAMGFNRTQYSLPELIQKWSEKVGAVGLREYYGVEAWDWGLPGRMRGGQVAYHRKWIPYYAKRKLDAINAETNSNWGAQTLGLYVSSQLMWNTNADVTGIVDRYYEDCFGSAAEPMRRVQARFDGAPSLRPATIKPMFDDARQAYDQAATDEVRARLVDMMAYLEYVAAFREFDLVRSNRPSRDDVYYKALRPLMQYAWQIRHRDMVHYYALARRLCNGLPMTDKRPDFFMFNKERDPVWKTGEPLTDDEIIARFDARHEQLRSADDPHVAYSRYFEPVRVAGENVGPCKLAHGSDEPGLFAMRYTVVAWLMPSGTETHTVAIKPTGRSASVTAYRRGDDVLIEKTVTDKESFTEIEIPLPKAGEYRVVFNGAMLVKVGAEAPFVIEASVRHPAWLDMSGPMYFYVPKGAKQVIADGNPRLSIYTPGVKQRTDMSPTARPAGKEYCVLDVPQGAAGQVWHTSNQTRGQVMLLNVPPLLSLYRDVMIVPREVAEGDGLTTAE